MKVRFPLDWPTDQARCPRPEGYNPAGCKDTLATACKRLERALKIPGVTDVEVSANVPVNKVTRAFFAARAVGDAGAVVRFNFRGQPYAVGQDMWAEVHANVWSLALMAEGLRQVIRHAGDALFVRMISGLLALPAPGPAAKPKRPWHEVLGLLPEFATEDTVAAIYRARARTADVAKDEAALLELNTAKAEALAAIKGTA